MPLFDISARLSISVRDFHARLQEAQQAAGRFARNLSFELARASRSLDRVGRNLLVAFGPAAFATQRLFNTTRLGVDELVKLSRQLGISTEALGAYENALKLADIEMTTFVTGLQQQARTLALGGRGATILERLGLDARRLRRESPERAFEAIYAAIQRLETPTQRSAAALAIWGRGGGELLKLGRDGASELARMRAEMESLGTSVRQASAESVERMNDALTTLGLRVRDIGRAIVVDSVPALEQWIGALDRWLVRAAQWRAQHRELVDGTVRWAGAIAAIAATAGAASLVLGRLLSLGRSLMSVVASPVARVAAVAQAGWLAGRAIDRRFGASIDRAFDAGFAFAHRVREAVGIETHPRLGARSEEAVRSGRVLVSETGVSVAPLAQRLDRTNRTLDAIAEQLRQRPAVAAPLWR